MSDDLNHIILTPEAATTIAQMWDEVNLVLTEFGENSTQYLKTLRSYAVAMKSIMGLRGRVMKDSTFTVLSLICQNEYITYGVIFDPRDSTWSVNS